MDEPVSHFLLDCPFVFYSTHSQKYVRYSLLKEGYSLKHLNVQTNHLDTESVAWLERFLAGLPLLCVPLFN